MGGGGADYALVQAWDRALAWPEWQRPAALAVALDPGRSAEELCDAPVGVVATRALAAAAPWFGPAIDTLFACHACGESMEASIPIAELLAGAPSEDPGPFVVDVGASAGIEVRLPRPADVAAATAAGSPDDVLAALLERTVLRAPAGLDVLACLQALSDACEARDPLGVVSVEVDCPACGFRDAPVLDVGQWCWAMVDARARRLLDEVHVLASAYGWSEQEILALGPHRRAIYLEWVA